jgi:hypothetical protein
LRSLGLPIPKIYGYSVTAQKAAGTKYMFMELVHGTNLGDVLYDLPADTITVVATKLVELEPRLFVLSLPASGSLYYSKNFPEIHGKVAIKYSLRN